MEVRKMKLDWKKPSFLTAIGTLIFFLGYTLWPTGYATKIGAIIAIIGTLLFLLGKR
jgi:hypothetical protein